MVHTQAKTIDFTRIKCHPSSEERVLHSFVKRRTTESTTRQTMNSLLNWFGLWLTLKAPSFDGSVHSQSSAVAHVLFSCPSSSAYVPLRSLWAKLVLLWTVFNLFGTRDISGLHMIRVLCSPVNGICGHLSFFGASGTALKNRWWNTTA